MKKALISFCILAGITPSFAQSVDLELGSVSTSPSSILAGTDGDIVMNFLQNGPNDLPIGGAHITVSIDTQFMTFKLPATVSDNCGNIWTIQDGGATASSGQLLLSNSSAVTNGADCAISLPIQGVTAGNGVVTVASTILAPGVSDNNGLNQGTSEALEITTPLPVTLSKFEVEQEGNVAQLQWETTEESNSDFFQVQRSADARNWNILTNVDAAGNSRATTLYRHTDSNPLAGDNFYRLKMVDRDGTFSFSRIRTVSFAEGIERITLAPNPVSESLNISMTDWSKVQQLEIFDLNGRPVYRSSNPNAEPISVKGLSTGMYVLRIAKSDGNASVHKFVVNH
ncbi:putative secreted protein (Por secretion system target) [Dyadobacter jejuensis]|uniref:Putative secreted protein (Por secretion system target) n=1 Tax=Dyadobacter jejuensis TaxID=1082580 RepID=A0A316APX2_9BACT|nr:T9SS type A sorting domain-containing protein [Dyadobacter jejuensis]PWJ59531.1 putative secreted protein (Por secretion system target) [Dyadobacter jejuensis]